ncbi:hypothetical protein COT29_03035 [Candidatus Micrarchaeota archaeon CG08_land_8_20_14_0_20_59_11]|nr:MAG: hypothetical protein COT29_03035 [Candidatus Micrarchaeota archaeon CG08_land_8_20_14_0_20_59_11]
MPEIRRVEPKSAFRVFALTGGLLGLLYALFAIVVMELLMLTGGAYSSLRGFDLALGIGAIIIFPLIAAGSFGFAGFFGAIVYNFAASKVGGLRVQVAALPEAPKKARK